MRKQPLTARVWLLLIRQNDDKKKQQNKISFLKVFLDVNFF